MKIFLLSLLFLFALFFEATVIQLPLVLLLLFILAVIYKSEWILPMGFFAGILLDGLTMRSFGASSLFFLVFLFLIFLYERKFELRSIGFVVIMSSLGSFFFLLIFGHVSLFFQVLASTIIGTFLFLGFSFFNPLIPKEHLITWKK